MKLKEYDIAEHLNNEEEMQMYLSDIQNSGDVLLALAAQEDIARARGMLQKSDGSGVNAG